MNKLNSMSTVTESNQLLVNTAMKISEAIDVRRTAWWLGLAPREKVLLAGRLSPARQRAMADTRHTNQHSLANACLLRVRGTYHCSGPRPSRRRFVAAALRPWI